MLKGPGGNKQASPGGSCHSFLWSLVVICSQTSCLCLWSRTSDREAGYLFPAAPNPQAECGARVSKIILSPRGAVCCVAVAVAVALSRPGFVHSPLPTLSAWDISPECSSAGCWQPFSAPRTVVPQPSPPSVERLNLSLLMCWVSERAWWVVPFVSIERGSSRVTGGPHIHCVAKEDPALLILLPQCRDYRLEAS